MSKRLQITITDDLYVKLEEYCFDFKYEISELVRQIIREYIFKIPKGGSPAEIRSPKNFEDKKFEESEKLVEITDDWQKVNVGFCQNHFEKGKQYSLKTMRKEDENGDILWEKDICGKCEEKIRQEVADKGGKLF